MAGCGLRLRVKVCVEGPLNARLWVSLTTPGFQRSEMSTYEALLPRRTKDTRKRSSPWAGMERDIGALLMANR